MFTLLAVEHLLAQIMQAQTICSVQLITQGDGHPVVARRRLLAGAVGCVAELAAAPGILLSLPPGSTW